MKESDGENEALKYCYKYPRPSVTTDCVVFGFDGARLSVLLVQRGAEPFKGRWAFPGGFMEMDESAEECVRRELCEETGLECGRVRQFHTFTAPCRDPRGRVITVAFYALVRPEAVCGGDDAADARWFALDAVPPLAFDHDEVLHTALAALRHDAFFEPVGADALREAFTMGEFRALCTASLCRPTELRNRRGREAHPVSGSTCRAMPLWPTKRELCCPERTVGCPSRFSCQPTRFFRLPDGVIYHYCKIMFFVDAHDFIWHVFLFSSCA